MRMAGGYRVNWNQLVDTTGPVEMVSKASAGVGVDITNYVMSCIDGHKYYINLNLVGNYNQPVSSLYLGGNGRCFSPDWNAFTLANGYKNIGNNNKDASGKFRIYYSPFEESFTVRPVIIDLTQMFGEGNEPPTVEAFEEWLAENHLDGYQPYNEGEEITTTKPSWL